MGFVDLRKQKNVPDRQEMLEHLKKFELDLKISVGIWYFTPGGGRFHDRYVPEKSILERLETAAEMAKFGVKGIEAHYPNEINEENVHLYKKLEKETGIRLVIIVPFLFFDREFEFGSLSNPVPKYRDRAIKRTIETFKLGKTLGVDTAVVWPGIDGYTYSYGHQFYRMWENFESGLAEAMDEVAGLRVAIEPKPYEPAPNNIYRTTADGLLLAKDVEARLKSPENKKMLQQGHALVGLNPEIGHVRMGFEDLPYVFARVMREGRLAHTHWNSQPLGNYDQDLNVGVVEWDQAEAALYTLKMYGYTGYFGVDINPERMSAVKAIEINAMVLEIMNHRINSLPHEKIIDCYYDPEKNRGNLEMILALSRK